MAGSHPPITGWFSAPTDITIRVYVPRSEVERVMEEGYEDVDGLKKCETEEEAFDYLAHDEIGKMFRSDADVKHYETNLH